MQRPNPNSILAFLAVAREGGFTRAAAKLGVSQSALSHTIRMLEEQMGLRLLTRTTRRVALTQAGERLLNAVGPRFDEIDAELAALTALRDKPAGNIRLTVGDHAARAIVWPTLRRFLPQYPDVTVEVVVDGALSDIVADRFDAGIRLGENVDRDMIAVPVGPEQRLAVVGSPAYFAARPPPPTPYELTAHNCVNMRLPTQGGLYAWEFEKDGRELRVRVEGQLALNDGWLLTQAALDGCGLACLLDDMVADHVAAGRLVRVLEDWCPPFPGYHLYYPSRRQPTPAFAALIEALRRRE